MSEVGKTIALIRALGTPTDAQVTSAVEGWLDDHPEATTTVTDGSITNAKLASSFVTPGTAAAYSSSATYAVGDYCFHNGSLYRCTTAITTAEAWTAAHWTAVALGNDVSDLKSAINAQSDVIHEITETYTPHNLYDYTKVEQNKYLNPNGSMENYNGRLVTDYIPATPGKYIVGSYISGSNNSVTRQSYSAICCYDENKNVVSGGDYNKSAFLVPSGVAYVRITYAGTMLLDTAMVENSDTDMPTTFEYYHEPTKFIADGISVYPPKMGYMIARGDIASDGSLYLPVQNVKNDNVLAFTANISAFDSIRIGKSQDAIVTIDSTNITIHSDQGDYTEAHGLTIENNIQILITNKTDVKADIIRIASNGQSHTVTGAHRFIMDEGQPFVTSVGSVLTDAVFAWTSRNINKPIWLFGDSYFSWYASRWTYYLAQDGYTKSCMLNGFAGENAPAAMTALRSLLTVRAPNIVVWCMGMNNADESNSVNARWKNAYDELVGLSKSYGFELILATIPNTPTVKNSYKNDIVINSGYRYIDFAKAVNIPGTSNWYSGMLDDDNVHPTAQGAVSLYGQVLADFPEITSI